MASNPLYGLAEGALPGQDLVFVVRMWLERGADNPIGSLLWRGRVTFVNSQQEQHVDGPEEAFDVVRSELRKHSGEGAS